VLFKEAAEIQANYYGNYGRNKFEEKKNLAMTHYFDLAKPRGGALIKY